MISFNAGVRKNNGKCKWR